MKKIEVFSRHCIFSTISQHKKRFSGFSREICYANLLETLDPQQANLTFFLDLANGARKDHFLSQEMRYPIVELNEGSEAGSFLRLLDHVVGLKLHPETILYFVEDDYLHRSGWIEILLEAFQLPGVDYVTLYDHRDKYFFPIEPVAKLRCPEKSMILRPFARAAQAVRTLLTSPTSRGLARRKGRKRPQKGGFNGYPSFTTGSIYSDLQSRLFITRSCHWRTTPSTTQTFAVRFKTLMRDLALHRAYSEGRRISRDHDKFCHLHKQGSLLVSPIPGWSTHAEPEFASPCIDWETYFKRSSYVSG